MHSHPHACYLCTGTWWTSVLQRGAAIRYIKGENWLFPLWLTCWKTISENHRGLISGQSHVKCSEIISGALEYDGEQSQASGLQWSAHAIASGNCAWPPSADEEPLRKAERPLQGKKLEATAEEREELLLWHAKKKKSKEAPRGPLIVVEDNGSKQKKKGCEEYPGEIQVSEISYHFCVWCFPYSSKEMTHLTRVLLKSTTAPTSVYLHIHLFDSRCFHRSVLGSHGRSCPYRFPAHTFLTCPTRYLGQQHPVLPSHKEVEKCAPFPQYYFPLR